MKSYSIDLRQKIVDVYLQNKVSIRSLAQRFSVAKSFVQKIIKQYQDTGDVSPLKRGGASQSKVQEPNLLVLENIIKNNNDCTLKELCDLLTLETGIQVSISTMWRLCEKLNYTVKKKLCTPQKNILKKYNRNDVNIGNKLEILTKKT